MILIDVNLLLYSVNRFASEHDTARAWLNERLSGTARVGLPWASLLAFVRLASNPTVFREALTVSEAWQFVKDWLTCDTVWIPVPGENHRDILGLLLEAPMTSRLVPDAHLAALAIEHGLTLCSTDGDFARFPGLTWINPLAAPRQA